MITLEQLSIYLPYQLKMTFNEDVVEIVGLELGRVLLISDKLGFGSCEFDEIGKPLLHPISKISEEPLIDELYILYGGGYKSIESFKLNFIYNILLTPTKHLSFEIIQFMAKNNIDIFGLIDKGFAESIN